MNKKVSSYLARIQCRKCTDCLLKGLDPIHQVVRDLRKLLDLCVVIREDARAQQPNQVVVGVKFKPDYVFRHVTARALN